MEPPEQQALKEGPGEAWRGGLISLKEDETMSAKSIALLLIFALLAGGCSGMSNTNQRMLSGGAMGAGTGLLVGGPVGAVVGAGVGAAGGYAYDQHQKSDGKP
jgi:hypothetical protein